MNIRTIQSTYPNAVWFDSAHTGVESGTFAEPYSTSIGAHDNVSSGGVIAVKSGTHQNSFGWGSLNKGVTIIGTGHDAILENSVAIVVNAGYAFIDLQLKVTTSAYFMLISDLNSSLDPFTLRLKGCKCVNSIPSNNGFISGDNNNSANTKLDVSDSIFELKSINNSEGAVLRTWNYGFLGDITFKGCTFNITEGTATSFLGYLKHSLSVNTVKNCIFVGHTGSETLFTNVTGTIVDSNNCYHNTAHSGGTDNVFEDPLFVDPTSNDFRLRPGSPCIGAGSTN